MELKNELTINGNAVHSLGQVNGLTLYHTGHGYEGLYIVDSLSGVVIASLDIECGMGQGCGYVEEILFMEVE